MKRKKEDRRIGRTRRMMQEALVSLIVEKGYESVTVQDILDHADVGRSTFYSHFRHKDELLLSGFDQLRTLFEQQQESLLAAKKDGKESEFNFVLEFFRHTHTKQHHKLYKAMVGKQSGEMILKYVHRYLFKLIRDPLAAVMKNRKTPPVPIDVTVHWLVSSLLALMTWSLDNNLPYSAEKMDEMFRHLTMPGIEAALGRRMQMKEYEKIAREYPGGSVNAFYSLFIIDDSCADK